MEKDNNQYQVSLKIPFPTKRHAEIAYDVLRIDAEPTRSAVNKVLTLDEHNLLVNFSGQLAKHVRVSLTSFYDALILCSETMNEFGPVPSEQYQFY